MDGIFQIGLPVRVSGRFRRASTPSFSGAIVVPTISPTRLSKNDGACSARSSRSLTASTNGKRTPNSDGTSTQNTERGSRQQRTSVRQLAGTSPSTSPAHLNTKDGACSARSSRSRIVSINGRTTPNDEGNSSQSIQRGARQQRTFVGQLPVTLARNLSCQSQACDPSSGSSNGQRGAWSTSRGTPSAVTSQQLFSVPSRAEVEAAAGVIHEPRNLSTSNHHLAVRISEGAKSAATAPDSSSRSNAMSQSLLTSSRSRSLRRAHIADVVNNAAVAADDSSRSEPSSSRRGLRRNTSEASKCNASEPESIGPLVRHDPVDILKGTHLRHPVRRKFHRNGRRCPYDVRFGRQPPWATTNDGILMD